VNPLVINDSISIKIGNGDLRYSGDFFYFIELHVNNESLSVIDLDKQSSTILSVYENHTTPYVLNYLSNCFIEPKSENKIAIEAIEKDILIESDFFSNRKKMKENHQFIVNLHFSVGDSIVKKEIVFSSK
jgi:hypothetical protein